MSDTLDPFDLNRFLEAQTDIYEQAVAEIKRGQKRSHWIWFIFPQLDGLAQSTTAKHYAIKSVEEAKAYLAHPVLGARLVECVEAALEINGRTANQIFGFPDDLKLRSSMTLFASISFPGSVFEQLIEKYFEGSGDSKTLDLLS